MPKKAANYSVMEQNALSDKHPKMTGQNDWPDESLTSQAHDQAGHCLLTGRYFEPWSHETILHNNRLLTIRDFENHSILHLQLWEMGRTPIYIKLHNFCKNYFAFILG